MDTDFSLKMNVIVACVLLLITIFIIYRHFKEMFAGDIQYHRRYPFTLNSEIYSNPKYACHNKAREVCHNEPNYDRCYESVLYKCSNMQNENKAEYITPAGILKY